MKCTTQKIDCFIPYAREEELCATINSLLATGLVNQIYLLNNKPITDSSYPVLVTPSLYHTETIKEINKHVSTTYFLMYFKQDALQLQIGALQHLLSYCQSNQYDWIYSDYVAVEDGKTVDAPLIDCQTGSVRDDFEIGAMSVISKKALQASLDICAQDLQFGAWYHLRLTAMLAEENKMCHVAEKLYTVIETDLRKSGEKQFDYVDPRNRQRQIEMEMVFTRFLIHKGKWEMPGCYEPLNLKEPNFVWEASVVIPVRNRVRTIGDAIESVLQQQTTFPFNLLIVDNYSTDGTSEIIEKYTADKRVKHIIPEDKHLGIGGCWNRAIMDKECGRFAVQLDSDDLYSSPHTLQKVVDKFYAENCAMVIGSYRMCNFQLETLPPGLIDHKEWTENNGKNNALRINGLGAPRAFFTPAIRNVLFPNTSYGEDYAMGLYMSKRFRIGRIYEELYLCRRWEGNSDAALSREKVNANNYYKDGLRSISLDDRTLSIGWQAKFNRQLRYWPETMQRYMDLLFKVQTKNLGTERFHLTVQYNSARMVSTAANLQQVEKRPCFLCANNRPKQQIRLASNIEDFEILINPFPILPVHLTAPATSHCAQSITGQFGKLQKLVRKFSQLVTFYNGPLCGASAPDHLHFQMGSKHTIPLIEDFVMILSDLNSMKPIIEQHRVKAYYYEGYFYPLLIVVNQPSVNNTEILEYLTSRLPMQEGEQEPAMNILSWIDQCNYAAEDQQITVIIPRKKHRPACYYATGEDQTLVSPGALDMSGLLITPRNNDFQALTAEKAIALLQEVAYKPEELRGLW